jgi:AcrR family transcriptional regulator
MRRRPQIAARKRPKQERAQATVEAILAATAHILVREGFEAASTNRIAEKAGVSIGSLYQYFPSKEAVVGALLEQHVREMLQVTREGLERGASGSLRERTRAMVRVMLAAHAVQPELHRVFMEEMPRVSSAAVAELDRTFEGLARVYLERDRALIRPRNLEIAAFIVVQAVEALTHAAVVHRSEMLRSDEFLDETTELIVRYLGAERGRRRNQPSG